MTIRANQNLDEMLEAVIVATWDDLIPAGKPGSVHVKYRFAADHSLADLQVWTSEIRGHWLLVCENADVPSAGKQPVAFSNSYRSNLLTQLLGFVVEHQSEFGRATELNRDSLVQVQVPTEDEKVRALKLVNEAQAPDLSHDRAMLANAG